MGTKEEIDAMFDALESTAVNEYLTDAPVTEQPEVKTEPPSTDPPDEPETDAPVTEEPETEAPTTEQPTDDELERFKRENEELRKKIDDMSAPKTKSPSTEPPSTFAPIEQHNFVDGIDIDDVTRDPEEFNKLLNKIYAKAVEVTRNEIQGRTDTLITKVPDMVKQNVSIQQKLAKMTQEFYEDNEDLRPFRKVVSAVYDELVQENPNETFEVILDKVEKETRSRLELPKGKVKKPKPQKSDDDPPKLPRHRGKKGARKTNQKTDPLINEIDEMNRSLNS
jgi:hypothetical protein